jgi:hypothetical protein
MYDCSRHAFDPAVPAGDALQSFAQIYDELVGGWGLGRNSRGPLWTAEKTFEFLKTEFSEFPGVVL